MELTIATFDKKLPVATMLKLLDGSDFERGPPVAREVAEHSELFREMLPKGYMKLNEDTEEVCFCHRRGWIYSTEDPLDPVVTRYIFPSPLHRASVSWRLQPTGDMPSFDSLYALSVSTISKFKPSRLRAPIRRPGQSTKPPPEAQYQQEFYRCVLEATLGHARITPEFAFA